MTFGAYDTRTMMGVWEEYEATPSFFLDNFFPFAVEFDTDHVDFDVIEKGGKKLAPFVLPTAQGRPVRSRGYHVKTFKPAYVKPLTPVLPNHVFKRRAGEAYGGSMAPGQRREATIADIVMDHRDMVRRRKEFMAAELLNTGMVTVKGENYPETVLDFGRDASLTKTLAGASRWGQAGIKPMDDIEDWADEVQTLSGIPPRQVIMEPKAWRIFRKDDDVKEVLDNRRQASGLVELGPTTLDAETRVRYGGQIGDFTFWIYQDEATEEDGATTKLMPDYGVTMVSTAIEGVQAHGAIHDPRAGYQAMEMYPKSWIEDNPSAEFVMTQSAPVVGMVLPNASLGATVN